MLYSFLGHKYSTFSRSHFCSVFGGLCLLPKCHVHVYRGRLCFSEFVC